MSLCWVTSNIVQLNKAETVFTLNAQSWVLFKWSLLVFTCHRLFRIFRIKVDLCPIPADLLIS